MKAVIFLLSMCWTFSSFGACTSPAGIAGQIAWISPELKYCDNANWISMTVSALGTTCSNPGKFTYQSGDFQFCNGTNWISAKGASVGSCSGTTAGSIFWDPSAGIMKVCDGTTAYIASSSVSGYFVLTATTYNGNLGGLSGANAKCLSELTTYDWLGKSNATIDSAHVRAFLCDGTTCQNPAASTIYKFAVANDASLGGASFTANASQVGPNDSADWSGKSYFGPGDKFYWTGRDTGGVTQWPTSATDTSHCNVWTATATATKGRRGYNVDTSQSRWNNVTAGCSSTFSLVCMVDP